jgi:hypothetical protein
MTVTVREVISGKAESPFDFLLLETDRAYRPSKTMRRLIVAALGAEASTYPGVRFTLYREPSIKFGGVTVGGIRISHMSRIEKPVEVLVQTSRGKREKFRVDPLPDTEPAPDAKPMSKRTGERLNELMVAAKVGDDFLPGVTKIIGREVTALDQLTELEGAEVVARLQARADQGAAS